MTEKEIRTEEAVFDVLVSFVQVGESPSDDELRWARANEDAKTPDYYRALRYAKAALWGFK